jgi:hypothetical protein
MTRFHRRLRVAFVALCAGAAIGSAAPAQASTEGTPSDCDVRVERLVEQFYDMADRRSYEDAAE